MHKPLQLIGLMIAIVLLMPTSRGYGGIATTAVDTIIFHSQNCKIVGELRIPNDALPYGVVVFVHGDGPNDRTSGGSYPPIMERILQAGYASFAWDKPGTGESSGQLRRSDLFNQRARIVLDAIEILKTHPAIDGSKIGLWGISQAGYVMPRVLEKSGDIAFMIAVSCPGEASVAQTAYLIKSQALCAGISSEEADKIEEYSEAAERAQSYEKYVQYKSQISNYPALEKMGIKMRVRSRAEWEQPDLGDKYFFDPISIIEKTTIPVLAFFGAKDTQVDPVQGVKAYRAALERAGNKNFRIELIPGVDHCMTISQTGCLSEVLNRNRADRQNYEPLFLDIIEEWLITL